MLQFGFYYYEVTIPRRGAFSLEVYLPVTYTYFLNGFMCVRNNNQFACGVIQPSNGQITLIAQSHSDANQSVYGAYWFTIGV